MIDRLTKLLGTSNVLTGKDAESYGWDWGHTRFEAPIAVLRPANTEEVSQIVKLAAETGTPVVPLGGRTGLAGGGWAKDALVISLERMNQIRDIRPRARSAVVEAGVVIAKLQEEVEAHDLMFPLFFGARGTATIGGVLSTNAGGSNVLRYGNTRDQVLGVEAVMPDGSIVNLMHDLHKNNSGYDLRHLLIGAEGTLGIITAAVVRLRPKPGAHATAMVAMDSLSAALDLLNRLQQTTAGGVEAFEYMPGEFFGQYLELHPDARTPFEQDYPVNILLEIGALAPRDCTLAADGTLPIVSYLEEVLGEMLEEDQILDAVLAHNEAQRTEMWHIREAAGEIATSHKPHIILDVAVPIDQVDTFLKHADAALAKLDPEAGTSVVSHLGDGNIHYSVLPSNSDPVHKDQITEAIEEVVLEFNGSFSAEHGVGTHKLSTMARRKDPAALAVMHTIKAALDPQNIMNPGKLLPARS